MSQGPGDTTRGGSRPTVAEEAEGYLLARTHLDAAHREAADLCAGLPWLTDSQAASLTEQYLRTRIDLTRLLLRAGVERAAQLRQEYECRYAQLRRALLKRHATAACAVLACAGGVGAAAHMLPR